MMSPPSYSAHFYFYSLEFPDVCTVSQLVGKSNFPRWHACIQPILLSNTYSSNLILGIWKQPPPLISNQRETHAGVIAVEEDRDEWLAANTATCRFIRATLALNVIPFVRQFTEARTLFFNLVWLYGDDAGIDQRGGPSVSVPARATGRVAGLGRVPVSSGGSNTDDEFWDPHAQRGRGRENLLAALEAKKALDYLPPVDNALPYLSSPTHPPPSPVTVSSSYSVDSHSYNYNNGYSSTPSSQYTLSSSSSLLLPTTVFKPTGTTKSRASNTVPNDAGGRELAQEREGDKPLTIVRIYERTRISPNPSLQTIHEEPHPHPGRRVPSGHIVDFHYQTPDDEGEYSCGGSISPLSEDGGSSGDDDDSDDETLSLSTLSDPDHVHEGTNTTVGSKTKKPKKIKSSNGKSTKSKGKGKAREPRRPRPTLSSILKIIKSTRKKKTAAVAAPATVASASEELERDMFASTFAFRLGILLRRLAREKKAHD